MSTKSDGFDPLETGNVEMRARRLCCPSSSSPLLSFTFIAARADVSTARWARGASLSCKRVWNGAYWFIFKTPVLLRLDTRVSRRGAARHSAAVKLDIGNKRLGTNRSLEYLFYKGRKSHACPTESKSARVLWRNARLSAERRKINYFTCSDKFLGTLVNFKGS
jgi:hypothetical protein